MFGSDFTWVLEAELMTRLLPRSEFVARYRYSEVEFESGGLYGWDDGQDQAWFFGLAVDL